MPNPPLDAIPVVRVAGATDRALTSLMIAVRVIHAEDGVGRLELRMINHTYANGDLGPVFGANAPWCPGSVIELAMEKDTVATPLFRGTVHLIEHIHPEAGAPEVLLRAADARQTRPLPPAADIPLAVGSTLLSARVLEGLSSLRLEAVGIGNLAIRVGSVVAVRGLAPQFATRYRVSTAVQQIDGQEGFRTGFTGMPITAANLP